MEPIFLITPPFTQLNTPYPATAYLKGFLNTKNISSFQMDLGIEVILNLFSKQGLSEVFDLSQHSLSNVSENAKRIFSLKENYISCIDPVIGLLQGKNQTLARQICSGNFLPHAARFKELDDLDWAFGNMGLQDKAKHLATLFLEDLSDYFKECVDVNFGFSRYAERLGRSANSFDDLKLALDTDPTYIDKKGWEILSAKIQSLEPKLVCFTVPFPGNLYSAFRCAKYIKTNYPLIKIAMGGGFPNTELRNMTDSNVFDYFDYITLDDGELPIELLFHHINSASEQPALLKRTFLRENDEIIYNNYSLRKDYQQQDLGNPDYSDLPLDKYISVIEMANPMHSLWSDGRWNKLTMAHGCYWGKCTFCDISLDYIKLYEPIAANILVDRMEQMIAQTGENGFHFVDEAAPPALMKAVAIEILRRKLTVSWWTNIRFEKSFTKDLCFLLKASGCIAVSGGLEVASDRLLALIQKGVTVEQVAKVTHHFTEAGIMVHAYLMYGYPTQTVQETVDSLEMVRQLFELGVIQSGFWHQFALTAHSPVGLKPDDYGIIPNQKNITFAHNDIEFTDKTGINHDKFSFGLKKSLFNYMHGICFEFPLQDWFDFKIPRTNIPKDYISNCIQNYVDFNIKPSAKVIWLGGKPQLSYYTKSKKGNSWEMLQLSFESKTDSFEISLNREQGEWLSKKLEQLKIGSHELLSFSELKSDFERYFENFELFWFSKPINALKDFGLLLI